MSKKTGMDEIEPDSRKRKKTAFITADLDKLKKAYTSLCFDKRNPLIAVMRQDTEDVQKSTIVSEIYTSCSLRHEDFSIFYMYHLYMIKYIIVLYRGGSYKIVKKLRDEPLWFTML